ncbi:MAG: SDR family oxidoreductase [Actinomycetota bacterium]|jgi:NAD(P)-dependent dehydrogenase (short-subunit alcohol dehydrogenase family)|nr:SDR family oxidoreductase [Actinomycetota bacterium]
MATASAFHHKIAIVTGAASGIGKALAAELIDRGAEVVVADIDAAGIESAATDLDAGGTRAVPAVLDVADAEAVRRLVESTCDQRGHLDFVFNNAGIGSGGPVEHLGLDTWRRTVEVDLMGVVHGVAAAYPLMVRQGFGHIVNTASLAGLVPSPLLTPYAAAKHAVVGLSVSLRVEAAAHGVRVSAVCPGPIETPLLDQPGSVNARTLLTNALGEPYPADRLAADVLDGVAANDALIVAPESARAAWAYFRQSPAEMLASMEAQAVASAERRAAEAPG